MNDPKNFARLLMRVKEAATYLAIGERKLWTLTNSGEIPIVKIGRSIRYDVRDLEAYVLKQKSGGAQ